MEENVYEMAKEDGDMKTKNKWKVSLALAAGVTAATPFTVEAAENDTNTTAAAVVPAEVTEAGTEGFG